ncbi:MAG: hypothetical protein J3K34DRAFT_249053 [Monoraphidium minutum]|nr:MAG: hypothetical protein J3K34DRAFT_249053 [Monoraphidium minutum]
MEALAGQQVGGGWLARRCDCDVRAPPRTQPHSQPAPTARARRRKPRHAPHGPSNTARAAKRPLSPRSPATAAASRASSRRWWTTRRRSHTMHCTRHPKLQPLFLNIYRHTQVHRHTHTHTHTRVHTGTATNPTPATHPKIPARQSRHGRGVESVVKALVDDTSALARAQRATEGLMAGQQAQLQDTKEALLRSAQVFASLLKVPAPVSSAQWASTPSKYGAAGSPLRSAGLAPPGAGGLGPLSGGFAGGGGGYSGGGGGGSPGGSPLLSSRYASLAAGL